jgi:hypothetical protein
LIRLLETIEDNRIMEAIRAKDRATAKKIVRKMEERAKRRAKEKTTGKLDVAPEPSAETERDEKTGKFIRHDKTENVSTVTDYGNSSTYRLGKIKRDHPQLVERIMAGEFKSVSEAERAAGHRPITEIKPTLGMVASVISWGRIRSNTINTGIWCDLSRIVDIPKIVHWGRNGETTRKKGAVCTLPHSRCLGRWQPLLGNPIITDTYTPENRCKTGAWSIHSDQRGNSGAASLITGKEQASGFCWGQQVEQQKGHSDQMCR